MVGDEAEAEQLPKELAAADHSFPMPVVGLQALAGGAGGPMGDRGVGGPEVLTSGNKPKNIFCLRIPGGKLNNSRRFNYW